MTFQGIKKIRTHNNVYKFWQKEGEIRGNGIYATLRDHYFRYVEIKSILKEIKSKKKHMLDIGCGNGISTFFLAPYAKKVTGIDYSKNLIDNANKFKNKKNFNKIINACDYKKLKSSYKNIDFKVGDILNLQDYKNKFDIAICSRVLINLGTQKQQDDAMKNVYDSLKKGSLLIINEVEKNNHSKLSRVRTNFGLDPLEIYWHNLYLREQHFLKNAKKLGFKLVKKIKYGEYQILSKVMYPKFIHPNKPDFLSLFNKFAADIFLNDKKLTNNLIDNFSGKIIKDKSSASHQSGYIFKK